MNSPILLLGDPVEGQSGLSRITRDLATVSSALPNFRVGSLGRGASGSSKLPWAQYSYPVAHQWGEGHIQKVWQDFAGDKPGTIMTAWDASRLLWFGQPQGLGEPLATFLGPERNFRKWGYFMVDATGPDSERLPTESIMTMQGYDRVLIASEWGAKVTRKSGINCDWIPHGIDGKKFRVFSPQERQAHRESLGLDGTITVGACMANQARKDFPIAFATAAALRKEFGPKFRFWLHTDAEINYWSVWALALEYGVADCLRITDRGTDLMMAAFYNCCDCTMLPSGGEGFGYPIAESLFCGTPCATQDYAAGAELAPEELRVPVATYRVNTLHNVLWAVHAPKYWIDTVGSAIEKAQIEGDEWRQELAARVAHLNWVQLKTLWSRWLLEGIK